MRSSARKKILAVAVGALSALYVSACGSHEWSEERKGGPLPPPDPGVLSTIDVPVTWCEAYQVINTVCQQCHHDPPVNGAPFPLLSYADTQGPYGTNGRFTVWQVMQAVVSDDEMPYRGRAEDGGVIRPTVQPLTPEQKNTLLGWLAQGAQDVGGEDCPMVYDWDAGVIPPGRE